VDPSRLAAAPKVLLHDHLDGGLRPATVLDLADAAGHALPTSDVDELAAWFFQGGRGADLPRYLETFDHTVACMQTSAAIERVARECAEDLAADGVVYAEVRYAPELSTAGGLSVREVLEAVAAGFAAAPEGIELRTLVCALRHQDRASEVFPVAAASDDLGVVGIDLAGPEAGFPASRHAAAIAAARDAGLRVTLHAGEAAGLASIVDALDQGAERLGHGVRLVEDLGPDGEPGPVARRVIDEGITLEVCPTSNVHTGVTPDVASSAFDRLRRAGVRVSLSTDNRLMSGVTASSELAAIATAFGYGSDDLESITLTGVDAAFVDAAVRGRLSALVREGYAAWRAGEDADGT
jgi:adenosine deaminase